MAAKPTVMVNGLPGNMGLEVSAACLRRGFTVAGIALTGPGMAETVEVDDLEGGAKQTVRLLQVPPKHLLASIAHSRTREPPNALTR